MGRSGCGWVGLAAVTAGLLCGGVAARAQTAHFSGAVSTIGSSFYQPYGVAVDSKGDVFVADNGHSAVKEIVAVGGVVSSNSTVNTIGSGFINPDGVAVDSSGDVFVADPGNNAVKEIVAVGGVVSSSSTVNTIGSGFSEPEGVAVDSSGNVFVADELNSAVKEIVAVGGVVSSTSTVNTIGSGFRYTKDVAVDSSGDVFVADAGNNAIKEIVAVGGVVSSTSTVNTIGSGFSNPLGVAVDGSGDVFVADEGNSAIKEIVAVGGVVSSSSTVNILGGGFSTPIGVAVDSRGDVFVADLSNNAVKEIGFGSVNFGSVAVATATPLTLYFTIDTAGAIGAPVVLTQGAAGKDFTDAGTGTCTTNGTSYSYAAGASCTVNATFTPAFPGQRMGAVELTTTGGTVVATEFIAGNGAGPEVSFTPGAISSVAGNGASCATTTAACGDGGQANAAQLQRPLGEVVDAAGNLYIADSYDNRVRRVTPAGVITTVAGNGTGGSTGDGGLATSAEINYVGGIAIDGAGNLYIADAFSNKVRKVMASTGIISTVIGSGISFPEGLAVDGAGNVYVADQGNHVTKLTVATGVLTVVAGNGTGGYSGDNGAATSAELNIPDGLALDSAGNLYIADEFNNRIRKVTAATGIITTVAGNGTGGFSGDGGAATGPELSDPYALPWTARAICTSAIRAMAGSAK